MRRFVSLILFIFITVTVVFPVSAQSEIEINEMQVKIWPEYDHPSVLVINNIFLSGNVKFPAKVSFNIPASAGEPHSVAVRELDGQLYLLEYEMKSNGEWNELTFTTPYGELWIEYYDPAIVIEGNNRSYAYSWEGQYLVKDFKLEIQQPFTATNMSFKESMGAAHLGNDGLTYFTNDVGEIKPNNKISLNIQYTKTDDLLSSNASMPVQPVSPLEESSSQNNSYFTQTLPYIVAGIGLVVLVAGVFMYLSRKKEVLPKQKGRYSSSRPRISSATEDTIFCHRCGRKADQGDVFCRACGTKLKRDE